MDGGTAFDPRGLRPEVSLAEHGWLGDLIDEASFSDGPIRVGDSRVGIWVVFDPARLNPRVPIWRQVRRYLIEAGFPCALLPAKPEWDAAAISDSEVALAEAGGSTRLVARVRADIAAASASRAGSRR